MTLPRRPLEEVIASWERAMRVEYDAAKRLDPNTRERELLEHNADTYACCIADINEALRAADTEPTSLDGLDTLVGALAQVQFDKKADWCEWARSQIAQWHRARTVPPVSARLRELAIIGAQFHHRQATVGCWGRAKNDGHDFDYGVRLIGFETCPHPDCALVRDLAVSPPVETK